MKTLLRYTLVVIFCISATIKWIDFSSTLTFLRTLNLQGWEYPLLAILICVEYLVVILLVLPMNSRFYVYTSISVMLIGLMIFSAILMYHHGENCGCFGTIVVLSPAESIIKNAILLIMVEWLRKSGKGRYAT